MLKVLVVNPESGLEEKEIIDELETYRDLIGCDWIDIARRNIGDKEYDIVVDDEGLLKENPIVSAFSGTKDPMLVGTMVICGTADSEGVLTGLSEEDLENIKKHDYSGLLRATCPDFESHHSGE